MADINRPGRSSTVTLVTTTSPLPVGPASTPKNGGGVTPSANKGSGTSGDSPSVPNSPATFTGAAVLLGANGPDWLVMWGMSVIEVDLGVFT